MCASPDQQSLSNDSEKPIVGTQQQENGRASTHARKTSSTMSANNPSTTSSIVVSTHYSAVYLTARELRKVESDPYLEVRDLAVSGRETACQGPLNPQKCQHPEAGGDCRDDASTVKPTEKSETKLAPENAGGREEEDL